MEDCASAKAENVEALGLTGASKIWRRDATNLGALDTLAPFDLAFLDPPYRKGLLAPALKGLVSGGWLNANALIVAEVAEDEVVPVVDGLEILDDRVYGDTRIAFMRITAAGA